MVTQDHSRSRVLAIQGHVFWGHWKGDKGQNNIISKINGGLIS